MELPSLLKWSVLVLLSGPKQHLQTQKYTHYLLEGGRTQSFMILRVGFYRTLFFLSRWASVTAIFFSRYLGERCWFLNGRPLNISVNNAVLTPSSNSDSVLVLPSEHSVDAEVDTLDTLEGRNATQRHLDRLKTWDHTNLMRFSKSKCNVLHMGKHNPKH